MHSDRKRFPGIHQTQIPLLQSPMAASSTPLKPMLGIAQGDLVCGCLAMEIHFMKLPMNSYFADIAVWNSVVSVATEDRSFLCASTLGEPVL
jgi:hypothetical protein